jgi:FkbM family methyltransferase
VADEDTNVQVDRRDGIAERVGKVTLQAIFRALAGWWPVGRPFEIALVFASRRYPKSRIANIMRIHWTRSIPTKREVRVVSIATGAKILIRLVPGQDQIYYFGTYEPATTAALMELTRPGDVIIDIGASIGYFSILCASLGAEVHAFEPEPESADQLERSLQLNRFESRLVVNRLAVADRRGSLPLHRSPGGAQTGNSSLLPLAHLSNGPAFSVEAETLDQYVEARQLRKVRTLKIDVEGAENLVLAGASGLLDSQRRPDVIVCETWSSDGGVGRRKIVDHLAGAGYRPYVHDAHRLVQLTEFSLGVLPSGDENIVFLHKDASC